MATTTLYLVVSDGPAQPSRTHTLAPCTERDAIATAQSMAAEGFVGGTVAVYREDPRTTSGDPIATYTRRS